MRLDWPCHSSTSMATQTRVSAALGVPILRCHLVLGSAIAMLLVPWLP